jgi:glycosyltransferase involved in cell wall biosynthesis
MSPLISIIIPNFNRELLIGETLDSIIAQSYTNWECIIVDDHSTDGSWGIVNGFCELDKRIRQVKRPDNLPKGASSCRNYGFEIASGSFVNWFDSDDIMVDTKLEDQMSIALETDCDVIVCQTAFFDKDPGQFLFYWNHYFKSKFDPLTDFITFRLAWSIDAPIWKKTFLNEKSLFDVSLKSSQDWEFHVRLLSFMPKMEILNETLVLARVHEGRIGVGVDTNRFLRRLITRELTFELLYSKDLLNKEIKNYYKSYFMNQLKYLTVKRDLINRLKLRIKLCVNPYFWFGSLLLRINLYTFIYQITGKKYWAFNTFIKQTINNNRR